MTRDQKTYRAAYWLASALIAMTFLSGYLKTLRPADFSLAVYRFHLLPDSLVNITALYFSWLEMVCGFCLLLVPKLRVSALWIALLLIGLFTVAIAINLVRGSSFGCGCFGNSPMERPLDWIHLARNLALIALALLALLSKRKSEVQPYCSV